MCRAPKAPKQPEPEKPEFLRNPVLDAMIGGRGMVQQLRTGRSSLRIPLAGGRDTPDIPATPDIAPITPRRQPGSVPGIPRRRNGATFNQR